MPGSCGWFPLGPDQIHAWVERHAHDLPRTLPELSRLPIPFRKAVVAALPAEAQASLWHDHIAGFLDPSVGLSDAQQELVRDALADLPAIFGGTRIDGQARARSLEERVRVLLTRQQAGLMFGTLGPPEPPEGLPIPPDALDSPPESTA